MNISILGAGSWGTALALALAPRHHVMLWGRNSQAIQLALHTRRHQNFDLPPQLNLTSDLSQAIAQLNGLNPASNLLIVATSVSGLRPLAQALQSHSVPNLVWLCKGLEQETQYFPQQVIVQELGFALPCGALSGPSFAHEVGLGLPCALTIASHFPALSEQVVSAVHGGAIRVYSSDDVVGVETGAAIKNVLAIATGISDGMGLGLNARAALITRGLAEMSRLGLALGGRVETFMGLTGMGDLILTCTGDLSRNRRVGMALAQGKPLSQIIEELGHVAEGVRCALAVQTLSRELLVEMPITNAVVDVLFNGANPTQMVGNLLARESKVETR